MYRLRDGGWTHVYMTDLFFDPESSDPALHNPWNKLPSYWNDLVKAVQAVRNSALEKQEKPKTSCCFAFSKNKNNA